MLLELYGENFGCFRDEFRLSMLATDIDPGSDRGVVEVNIEGDDEPLRLLRAVAIYGPNASGKSTVLRAANALRWLILKTREMASDAALTPYEPFALAGEQEPVRLGIKCVIDHRVYDYEVCFDRTHFLSERLSWLGMEGEQCLLDRQNLKASGEWLKDDRFAWLAKDFRENVLLLALADRFAPTLSKNIAGGLRRMLRAFVQMPDFPWRGSFVARRARDDSEFSSWLLAQLKSADLGVEDLRVEEEKTVVHFKALDANGQEGEPSGQREETRYYLTLLHRADEGAVPIPYHRESGGTRRLVDLSRPFYDLAHSPEPTALFVDEIHESLHPTLLQSIIRHFNCETPMDEVRGQLIFATHETALLDAEAKNAILRRDQVYLTEKDASGAARLYSVAEFKERNNLNLRRRYLQGRYGALPSWGSGEE
jgi:AAA15 family ATPase/GTPase